MYYFVNSSLFFIYTIGDKGCYIIRSFNLSLFNPDHRVCFVSIHVHCRMF